MQIIVLYDYFSPAYKAGGPVQSLTNMAARLRDHLDLRVVCSNQDLDGTALEVPVGHWTIEPMTGVPAYYAGPGFAAVKEAFAKLKPGVLFINGLYSLRFNLLPMLVLRGRKIVSVRGMLHPGALSQKRLKKNIYLTAWKLLGLHRRCEFHATTEEEREHVRTQFGRQSRVWVIPNFPKVMEPVPGPNTPGHLHLGTVALISPMKNHLLVLEALAQLAGLRITYHIYGPVKDAAYWEACQAQIAKLPEGIEVIYYGDIRPDRVGEALQKIDVCIQPSKSENFGHSIFEALTAGKPVITSHFTPWNGPREQQAGINADTAAPGELAAAIRAFAERNGTPAAEAWSASARSYALRSVQTGELLGQYLEMFK